MSSDVINQPMGSRARRRSKGACEDCGGARGKSCTGNKCRACADNFNARASEWRRRRIGEGKCAKCGQARDREGTLCSACEAKDVERRAVYRRRRIDGGFCPDHGGEMPVLERCPACRYERSGGQALGLTFEGLLPHPASGDGLESCVGCKNCDRVYHAGSSYSAPRRSAGMKLPDEHVGEEGNGLWLRFSLEDEQGVPVEYEGCSTPDAPCTGAGWVARASALDYLRAHRRGEKVSGLCYNHARHPRALTEIFAARLRHQLGSAAQTQNGSGLAGAGSKKRGREVVIIEEKVRAAFKSLGQYAPQEKLAEEIGVDPRSLRDWHRKQGLNYRQCQQRFGGTGSK